VQIDGAFQTMREATDVAHQLTNDVAVGAD
jgi:hypothetical protein